LSAVAKNIRLCITPTLTLSRERPTIVAQDDVFELVSTRDKIREALTLVSFRD
jgi:hypothetical protein